LYQKDNGGYYGGNNGIPKTDNYISRKELILQGVTRFIDILVANDPEALVYIIYFNNHILVPKADYNGY
jgi:hypothetical protein